MPDNERQFEQDIESFLISPAGGWQKASDAGYRASMDSSMALDLDTLVGFIQTTQPIQWQRFEKQCNSDAEKKSVSYTHLRAHETGRNLVCRLLLEKKKKK